jgi:threonylcarbamoyladenosine tRNA methylthiotransferase MtaB
MAKTALIHTLGCRLNQADSALLADRLESTGFTVATEDATPDLIVINGCVVTATAGQKTRQAIRNARKRNPDAFIVLVGCAGALEKKNQSIPADLILDNSQKSDLLAYLPPKLLALKKQYSQQNAMTAETAQFNEPGTGLYPNRTRANLKVQEGCNFFCSYCIVPYVRGTPRSRDWNDVIREARELIARGHRELVLTGVNLGTYEDNGRDLADLLRALTDIPGDFRIRLGSIEPIHVVRRVIDVIAERAPRICRFLHLPLQYGEDSMLKAMNRRYSIDEYYAHAIYALEKIDGLCLGTDLIVGFPGETNRQFDKCTDFLKRIAWGNMHVFRYSPRTGTAAAKLKKQMIDGILATERSELVECIYHEKLELFKKSQQRKNLDVLFEKKSPTQEVIGWSDNYLEVLTNNKNTPLNSIKKVKITKCAEKRRCLTCE